MCGPTGIGFLWGKYEVLEASPPWQGGGEMIDEVFLDHSTYALPPGRFEAGTPAIAQAVGLGAACDYLSNIGMDKIHQHEVALGEKLWAALSDPALGLRLLGPSPEACRAAAWESCERGALVAFEARGEDGDGEGGAQGAHASDLTFFLDQDGVAVRSGHHCTQVERHCRLGGGKKTLSPKVNAWWKRKGGRAFTTGDISSQPSPFLLNFLPRLPAPPLGC